MPANILPNLLCSRTSRICVIFGRRPKPREETTHQDGAAKRLLRRTSAKSMLRLIHLDLVRIADAKQWLCKTKKAKKLPTTSVNDITLLHNPKVGPAMLKTAYRFVKHATTKGTVGYARYKKIGRTVHKLMKEGVAI